MDFSNLLGPVWGDFVDVRLQGGEQIGVELRDQGVVGLLLVWLVEYRPGEIVNIPRMREVDVGEPKRDGVLGLGQRCDVEVGS